MLTLNAEARDIKADLSAIRKEGKMPAIFYGKKTESTPISILQKEFLSIWHKAGESTVVTIKTPTGSFDTLIHDVDVDPVTDNVRHADFYVFEKGKKVEISVPIEFVGVSAAVKDLGGVFIKALHELKISAEPQNLPHSLEIDISPLANLGDVITADMIKLPAGVELIELPTEVVASAVAPKEEVEAAPVDLSAIEVEKKGKKEEEAEVPAE